MPTLKEYNLKRIYKHGDKDAMAALGQHESEAVQEIADDLRTQEDIDEGAGDEVVEFLRHLRAKSRLAKFGSVK